MKTSTLTPALIVAIMLTVTSGIFNLAQLDREQWKRPVRFYMYMMDYYDFYCASRRTFNLHESPYESDRFVTPPTSALLFYPLAVLEPRFKATRPYIAVLILLAVVAAFELSICTYFGLKKQISAAIGVVCLIVMLFSNPFYFIFDRGNIDWIMLILFWSGLALVRSGKSLSAGLLWGLATCIKVYTGLLIIPLLLLRKWKSAGALTAAVFVCVALQPRLWLEYLTERLMTRSTMVVIGENVSLSAFWMHLFAALRYTKNSATVAVLGMGTFVLILSGVTWCVWRCRKSSRSDLLLLLYVPLMFMIPNTVFAYGLIFFIPLLPVLCYEWSTCPSVMGKVCLAGVAVGIGISQMQVEVLSGLVVHIWPHVIPGLGVIVTSACLTLYVWSRRHVKSA